MKNAKRILSGIVYLLAGGLLILLASLLAASCNSADRCTTEVSVLEDMTEAHKARPNVEEIAELFGLEADKWNGAAFQFAYLTDVSYNRRTKLLLAEGGNRLTASSFTRNKEVQRFEDSLSLFFASLALDTVGRPHSSVIVPLAEELNRLATSQSDKKILIIYGDLMENEPGLSFYDKKTRSMLSNEPDKLKSKLLEKVTLSALDGIEVYIIFQPVDAAQDELFRLVSGFYKNLLEEHGARVTVAANIPAATNLKKKP